MWSLLCSQARQCYFHFCLLWTWPLTSSSSHHWQQQRQVWSKYTQGFYLNCVYKVISTFVIWSKYTEYCSLHYVHKVISTFVYCDLDLWPSNSIGFMLSSWATTMPNVINIHSTVLSSIVFARLFPLVFCDLDLWPPKSIGFILSSWATTVPSLIKIHSKVWSLLCQQGYFHFCLMIKIHWTVLSLFCSQCYFHFCQLWPWPLNSKINRVHPLIMGNNCPESCVSRQFICIFMHSCIPTCYVCKSRATRIFLMAIWPHNNNPIEKVRDHVL